MHYRGEGQKNSRCPYLSFFGILLLRVFDIGLGREWRFAVWAEALLLNQKKYKKRQDSYLLL